MTRESDVLFAVAEAWGAHPRIRIARINTGKAYPPGSDRLVTFGVPGTADLCGIIAPHGRFLAIECKTPKGRQSDDQRRFERAITAAGGLYILARSLSDVDAALAVIGITR